MPPPWPSITRWGSADSPGAGYATSPNTRVAGSLCSAGSRAPSNAVRATSGSAARQREQFPRLHLIANNTRMLMLWPPGTIRNLASCIMAANLRRLSADWQAQFGHPLELAETFVDPTQFVGTMYRAGNWIPVGRTRGFARSNGRYTEPHGRLKEMYLYAAACRRPRTAACSRAVPHLAAPAPTGGSCRCPVTLVAARVRAYPRSSTRGQGRLVSTRGPARHLAVGRGCPVTTASMPLGATPVISLRMSCSPLALGATSAPVTTIHPPAPPSTAP